jgi:sulfite exporter TauE/SafE
MSFVPEISNPFLGALVGGLFYGFAVCTSACLPYVTSYIAGIGAGFRKGVVVTLFFNSGRIAAYALLGAAIGVFKFLVSDEFFTSFQSYSSFAFAIVTIAIGTSILLKSKPSSSCNYDCKNVNNVNVAKIGQRFDYRAFSLGLSRGLLLCTPLMWLLLYSVPFGTPIDSLALAVLFGLGTALSPMLLLGGATGWLLNKAPLFRKWISILGGGILIVLGLVTLASAISLI